MCSMLRYGDLYLVKYDETLHNCSINLDRVGTQLKLNSSVASRSIYFLYSILTEQHKQGYTVQ
jgi:hypothetical protein